MRPNSLAHLKRTDLDEVIRCALDALLRLKLGMPEQSGFEAPTRRELLKGCPRQDCCLYATVEAPLLHLDHDLAQRARWAIGRSVMSPAAQRSAACADPRGEIASDRAAA